MPLRSRDYWTSPRLDILSELRRRNLDHLVERVVAGLDPASARAAARVSADWRQMVAEAADARRRRRRRRRRRNMERREEDRVSASRETVEGASAGVTAVAVDEEGTTVVLGTQDGSVVLLDHDSLSTLGLHRAHSGPVSAVSLSPGIGRGEERGGDAAADDDGGLLLTGSVRGSVRIWRKRGRMTMTDREKKDVSRERERGENGVLVLVASLPCHRDWVTSLASPIPGRSFSCSLDGRLSQIDFGSTARATRQHQLGSPVSNSSSKGSRRIRITAQVTKFGRESQRSRHNGERGGHLECLSASSKCVLVGGSHGAWIRHLSSCGISHATPSPPFVRLPGVDSARACALVAEASLAAAVVSSRAGTDTVRVFSTANPATPQGLTNIQVPSAVTSLCVLGSETLAIASADRVLRTWRGSSGLQSTLCRVSCLPRFLCAPRETAAALLSCSADGRLVLLDTCCQEEEEEEEEEDPPPAAVAGPPGFIRRCRCGYDWPEVPAEDQTAHLLMDCPLHDNLRRTLLKSVSAVVSGKVSTDPLSELMPSSFLGLPRKKQFEVLLYGSDELDSEDNLAVQSAVQDFARALNAQV